MKNNKLFAFILIVFILIFKIFTTLLANYYYENKILNVELNDENKISIKLKNNNISYCYMGENLNNVKWTKSENKECILEYKENNNKFYIKNLFGKIFEYDNSYDLTKVTELNIKNSKMYLAINGTEKLEYKYETLGKVKEEIIFKSENNDIATVDNLGNITGVSNGETKIKVIYKNKETSIEVVVTDMIDIMPNEYNFDREFLSCNRYTKEENDFLDEILKDRVNDAGYKTRAGVVAAARFLALEFPYKIGYFSENGRLNDYGAHLHADGEGRYYHQGLYLNESRYENITTSVRGPGTWGCDIYSIPSGTYVENGLDCSGFITWILYNGGFDCGDIGAGLTTTPDMTDLGKKIWLTKSISENKIKAGDLLSGAGSSGGHIALVAGFDENNYYIAESLWRGSGYFGSIIRTYKKYDLANYFYWHIDMDDYYKKDGNYTEYWN